MSSPKPKQGTLLTHSLSFKHLDVTCTPQTPQFPTLTRPVPHPPSCRQGAPCPARPCPLLSMVPSSHSLPLPLSASSPGRRRQNGECWGWAGLHPPPSASRLRRDGLSPLPWVRAGRPGRRGGFSIPGWQRRAPREGEGPERGLRSGMWRMRSGRDRLFSFSSR